MRVNDINLCGAVQRVRLYYSTAVNMNTSHRYL
jgi:hypothetical protein